MTLDTPLIADPDLLSSNLGGEEVLLSLDTGVYYGLNEVGAQIWSLLREPQTPVDICDHLEPEYDVDRATLERDVLQLLEEMEEEGLVEIAPETESRSVDA